MKRFIERVVNGSFKAYHMSKKTSIIFFQQSFLIKTLRQQCEKIETAAVPMKLI